MIPTIFFAMAMVFLGQVEVIGTATAPYSAMLKGISEASVTVAVDGQVQDVPLGELRKLKFVVPAAAGGSPISISLRDGSLIAAQGLTSDGSAATISLPSGLQIRVETKYLRNVRLNQLTQAQQSQWETICQSRIEADVLVLIRSPESLDKIEGLIQAINSDTIDFDFSGQNVPAPLAKLAGIRFFTASEAQPAKAVAIVQDRQGGMWNVARLQQQADGPLQLTLCGGLRLELPLEEVAEIDFSVGSMKYLAELDTIERRAASRFDLGISIVGTDQVFGARVVTDKRLPPSIEFLGSGTSTYRVPADFTRLVGAVELAPPGNKLTACVVKVLLEKKVVWEKRFAKPEQPAEIDIAVTGDQRLQLVVQAESKIPVGDVVLFRELRFLK